MTAVVGRTDANSAAWFSVLLAVAIFATTISLLHIRARSAWFARDRQLSGQLTETEAFADRARLFLATDAQAFVTWVDRSQPPEIEGDVSIVVDPLEPVRLLAFGQWLPPDQARTLEVAVDRLRDSGESFQLALRSLAGRFIEADGRAVTGRAVLRLRETTGDRLALQSLRAAHEDMEAQGETLRRLLDAIPQPVWQRDRSARLAWVNAAYARAVEAPDPREAARQGIELLERGDREKAVRARGSGQVWRARVPAIAEGARRVYDVVEAPSPEGSAGMADDASEAEQVRADLMRQMDAHSRLLDQLATPVAVFDETQRLVFHNAAYRDLWQLDETFLAQGPSDGEILDRLRTERRLPEQPDYRGWKAQLLGAYRALETREHWWYLNAGRTLRVVVSPNPQGGVTYLFDDATERFRLETQFKTLMQVQSETLDALTEGVAVFGSDGKLKLHNPSFLRLWSLTPEKLGAHAHVDQVIALMRSASAESESPQAHVHHAPDVWDTLRRAVSGLSDQRAGASCRLARIDGRVIDVAAAPLPDGGTLVTFADVSASVNMERALLDRNEALEKAARLRDDFVHHVSYELRSPLTNIIGFTQLLAEGAVGALNPRQQEYASHIMRSSSALLTIINDILDLATIDDGDMPLDLQPVDVRESIATVASGVQDRLVEAGIHLEIDCPAEIGTMAADAKRLRQILFNLVSNAISFSVFGQAVTVRARRAGAEVEIAVIDQGRGIPADILARVFERFESNALGARRRGVGLGLSIVKSFVELHGGTVRIVSEPGRGTTVICAFRDAAAPSPPTPSPAPSFAPMQP